ncbi:hypothetical protein BGZ92_002750 [Podila epicladia]|nr:hypothetical protein BGZ92_002750 [Podila epicladia]
MDYLYDSTSSSAFDLITLSADTHSLVSLRCKPTLTALPPELLSRVGHNLSLCEYSCLSRTSKRFHGHLFRPSEIVLFLKSRYRLSIESGSIIIFAYLANMQVKAPLLLEKIFDDFFADSALHQQEEYLIKQQQKQKRELLSHNTYLLNKSITGPTELNDSAITFQRMNALHSHRSAEQARKQAKWDAVRMLGVFPPAQPMLWFSVGQVTWSIRPGMYPQPPHLFHLKFPLLAQRQARRLWLLLHHLLLLLLHRHRTALEPERRMLAHIEADYSLVGRAHDRSKDLIEILTNLDQISIHTRFDTLFRGEVCVNGPQLFNTIHVTLIQVVPMLLAIGKTKL